MKAQWYSIRAQADSPAEIWIYEEIGEDWLGEGVTAKAFVAELNALSADEIALHINSPGGSVFDGQAIYTALRRHPATITSYIDGLAASIASVVALAGDRVVMPSNAMMMIHDPYGMALGTAQEMRQMADTLDAVRETILSVYADHSSKTREELSAAMTAETWLTAADALDFGFIEEIAEPVRMAAQFDLSRYRHPPTSLFIPASGPDAEVPPAVAAEATEPACDLALTQARAIALRTERRP